jgi:hypothetical protein
MVVGLGCAAADEEGGGGGGGGNGASCSARTIVLTLARFGIVVLGLAMTSFLNACKFTVANYSQTSADFFKNNRENKLEQHGFILAFLYAREHEISAHLDLFFLSCGKCM